MKHRVLVFPAGTEIALEIHNALKNCKDIELIGATSADDHSEMVFERLYSNMPYVDDPCLIDALNQVIRDCNADIVYPAHDSVLLKLTAEQHKIDALIMTSPLNTVDICRNKKKTYSFLKQFDCDFLPEVYEDPSDVKEYPVFAKPAVGQGSHGIRMVYDDCEFLEVSEQEEDYVICENLPGAEFTVDCFTDKNGDLRYISQRTRERIRNGIAVRSEIVPIENCVWHMAKQLNNYMYFTGAWFFQIKMDANNKHKLLEIAPRIAGTMGLSRNRGVNLPLLSIYTLLEMDVEIIDNRNELLVDRALISRFRSNIDYTCVYVDFDDTLLLRGKVNPFLIAFLYQAKGNGKRLYLLTRHHGDIFEDLKKNAISLLLFNAIISLNEDEEKSDYIMGDAIFIDDSYVQRKKVHEECGVPVFDLDMVESLFDWSA